MPDLVSLSGGPVEGDVDGTGWIAGEEKTFDQDGHSYKYRRLTDDELLGTSSKQAVYSGLVI